MAPIVHLKCSYYAFWLFATWTLLSGVVYAALKRAFPSLFPWSEPEQETVGYLCPVSADSNVPEQLTDNNMSGINV